MINPAPFIGIMRHRIGIDGEGVTTLAAFHGCPLQCKYCLNPSCHGLVEVCRTLTPEQLYEEVRIDQLYFLATHGGVCFGGGEPLLRSDFIVRFRELCGPDWQLTLETSLYVPQEQLKSVLPVADYFIVDIKDLHPDIYQKYTERPIDLLLENLKFLSQNFPTQQVMIRVPLIPNYNTDADRTWSVEQLMAYGFQNFDRFEYRTDIAPKDSYIVHNQKIKK